MIALVKFTLERGAKAPTRGTSGAAGWDLYVMETVNLTEAPILMPEFDDLNVTSVNKMQVPLDRARVVRLKTGLRIQLAAGYYAEILPRSSSPGRNIMIHHGLIDEDYTGEVFVQVWARDPTKPAIVKAGERVAQLVIRRYEPVMWAQVHQLDETERGEGGFGSTGK